MVTGDGVAGGTLIVSGGGGDIINEISVTVDGIFDAVIVAAAANIFSVSQQVVI